MAVAAVTLELPHAADQNRPVSAGCEPAPAVAPAPAGPVEITFKTDPIREDRDNTSKRCDAGRQP